MTDARHEYVKGFMAKCAVAGIDPEALLKFAQGAGITQRVPRQFPEFTIPESTGSVFSGLYGSKKLPALSDPAVVAGKAMPSTDIKNTKSLAGSGNARIRQLETIGGR